MAKMLIQSRKQPFQPSEFVDKYEEAVRNLVMSKAKGDTPVYAEIGQPTAIIDLMKALKESLEKEGAPARKPAARGKRAPAAEPAAKPARGKQPAAPADQAESKPARRRKAS